VIAPWRLPKNLCTQALPLGAPLKRREVEAVPFVGVESKAAALAAAMYVDPPHIQVDRVPATATDTFQRLQMGGKGQATHLSASAGTGSTTSAVSGIVNTPTCAPGVVMRATVPKHTLPLDQYPIVTPLRWKKWHVMLEKAGLLDRFADVSLGLHYGFPLGVTSKITSVFSPNNHKSAFEFSDFVSAQINAEVECGRYSSPLPYSEFLATYGPFRTSPLGVVVQPSGKKRLIQDHSFPRDNPYITSINSEIDGSLFQCDWGSFVDCFSAVLSAPPGTQVAIFNVDAAHRRMPSAPCDRLHVCVKWSDLIYMDHCCCFGCTSSSGIFGHCADAIKAIYLWHLIDLVLKWADDFSFWRYPATSSPTGPWAYRVDESLIWDIANELGWPWSADKSFPFSFEFKYLGFQWDLTNKTVCLALDKKAKFLHKLDSWRKGCKVSKKTCLSLIGSLSHCSVIIKLGRSHLASLFRFSSRFSKLDNEFISLLIPGDVLSDTDWWRSQLSADWCGLEI
jgi:hypothetical protein